MTINSGVSEEEVLNSFENISLQTNKNAPDAPKDAEKGVEDLLGQPLGKFDYKIFYTKPPSFNIPIESIIPGGQGEEFNDEDSPNEKAVEPLIPEQPQQGAKELSGQQLSKFEDKKQLDKKETCTVGVWKDEVIEKVTEKMQEQRVYLPPKEENPDAPKSAEKVEDLLGQPSGKFDYKVFYSKPPSYDIPIKSIIPGGWGDEFENDEPVSEKNKRVKNSAITGS